MTHAALEQRRANPGFQCLDLMTDGRWGHAKFGSRVAETLEPSCRSEGAQARRRRQIGSADHS
jgi:hypothetical protein